MMLQIQLQTDYQYTGLKTSYKRMSFKENQDFYETVYDIEMQKIPHFFRLTEQKIKLIVIFAIVYFAILVIMTVIGYLNMSDSQVMNINQFYKVIIIRPGISFFVFLFTILLLALLLLWITICRTFEKNASSRASELAFEHSQWMKRKIMEEYRSTVRETTKIENEQNSNIDYQFCPRCGLLMFENDCKTCDNKTNKKQECKSN